MLPKEIKYGADARTAILDGANSLANAVKATLGPRGRNVMINKGPHFMPRITKDGVTVAKEISFKDPFKNMGAQTLREVASKACDKAGDGTTTATVLAQALFNEGAKAVAAGMNPTDIKRGVDKAVGIVVESIKASSKNIETREEWVQVATLSANGDKEVGEKIAEALHRVGKEGVVTVEENKGRDFDLDVVEGMQFDRGFLSPYFVNKQDKMVCEFVDPLILIFDKKVAQLTPIIPLLELAVQQNKPLLIIADDVEGEALSLLVVNKMRAGMQVCAVKAPGFGERKKEYLDDIATLTGGEYINEDLGMTAQNVTSNTFGRATKVIVTKDDTIIIGGQGDKEAISTRCDQLRSSIEAEQSDYVKEKLKERLAKLTGGVAVLKVGGSTEIELKERRDRVDDALHATRAALEEGIVPGGGTALLYASRALDGVTGDNEDQNVGINIVRKALQAPVRQIVENAGMDGVLVAGKLLDQTDNSYGFDAQTLTYVNLIEKGIIDPTKVVRVALQDASSVAGLLITTEVIISELPEDKKPGQPA